MERFPFPGPSFTHLSGLPLKQPPLQVPLTELPYAPVPEPVIYISESTANEPPPPSVLHQKGPYGDRCSISKANGWFIHLYLSESPVKEISHETGGKHTATELHADEMPTYNGVRPGSRSGSFTTLLSLQQCQAAFSMIPSTVAWVDQSPVSQRVLW
jgi:hypothetical protein